jgi:murein DD-endopeptidase MepM/ murein hydrolase activator NlpD
MLDHLASVNREDEKLSVFAWELSRGWFPTLPDRQTLHSGMDIGLPDAGGESYAGATVHAISGGEVIYADQVIPWSEKEYDFGRVIVRHPTPGGDAYVLYMHLGSILPRTGDQVSESDVLSTVGWHGKFHHLHFAVASQQPLAGPCPEQMLEAEAGKWPEGDGRWNVLRLKIDTLDPNEWPGMTMFQGPWYLIHPIEFVRAMRGLDYSHYNGVGSPHTFLAKTTTIFSAATAKREGIVKVGQLLRFKALAGDQRLLELAHGSGQPLARGDDKASKENKDAVGAMQDALIPIAGSPRRRLSHSAAQPLGTATAPPPPGLPSCSTSPTRGPRADTAPLRSPPSPGPHPGPAAPLGAACSFGTSIIIGPTGSLHVSESLRKPSMA